MADTSMCGAGEPAQLIIEGVTEDGRAFRPSDWIERLIDTAGVFGADRRSTWNTYSGPERRRQQTVFLQAQMIDGRKCLIVDTRLRHVRPAAFDFVLQFVRSNRLRCLDITTNTAAVDEPRPGSDMGTVG